MLTVGMGDCKVTNAPDAVLTGCALGNGLCIAMHDPVAHVAGLLHFMLPDSGLDRLKAQSRPFVFADTGITALLRSVSELGGERQRLIVDIIGGPRAGDSDVFRIGERNHKAALRVLWSAGVFVHSEQVGGSFPRSIRVQVGTGETWVRNLQDLGISLAVMQGASGGLTWRSTS